MKKIKKARRDEKEKMNRKQKRKYIGKINERLMKTKE